jgi:hypothetical protein
MNRRKLLCGICLVFDYRRRTGAIIIRKCIRRRIRLIRLIHRRIRAPQSIQCRRLLG